MSFLINNVFAQEIDLSTKNKNIKKDIISIGISVAPAINVTGVWDFPEVYHTYFVDDNKPFMLWNYNFKLEFLIKSDYYFQTGYSLMNYGNEQDNVKAFLIIIGHGVNSYENISIKIKASYTAFPFSIIRYYHYKKFSLSAGIGFILNTFSDLKFIPINSSNDNIEFQNFYDIKGHFTSYVFSSGINYNKNKWQYFVLLGFNFIPGNISTRFLSSNISMRRYQYLVEIGLKYKILRKTYKN